MDSTAPRTTATISATSPGPVEADTSFVEHEADVPALAPHDLLVEVRAVSVNPVDTKVRVSFDASDGPRTLGFDAAGVVVAAGAEVTAYAVGDEVFYAGSIARPGTNTRVHVVDERIVGRKPSSLDFAEAAALPLTSITAWETLFERLALTEASTGTLLVMGAAGGVGSMVVQLARALTDVTVVAAGSREEAATWATSLGAHHTVDRHRLADEVAAVAPDGVDWVFSPYSAGMVQTYADLMRIGGTVVAIDEPEGLDTLALKDKSQAWAWELMFSRPLFDPTSTAQRELLDRVADLVDGGVLRSTLTTRLDGFTADNLREAHRRLETSASIGKVVVAF